MKKQLVVFPIAAESVHMVSVGVPDLTPKETTAGGLSCLKNQFRLYRVVGESQAAKI